LEMAARRSRARRHRTLVKLRGVVLGGWRRCFN
jgi:hypothetical protein